MCGTKVRVRNHGAGREQFQERGCGLWQICPYCCHLKRQEILRKFLPSFQPGAFYLLSVSYARSLDVEPAAEGSISTYWSAVDYALRRLLEDGVITGAFILEDCLIESYYPNSRILPHVHAVVRSDRLTRRHIDKLKALIRRYDGRIWDGRRREWYLPDFRSGVEIAPETQTWLLPELPDFCSALCYLVKPVDFCTPYKLALEELKRLSADDQQRLLQCLNQEKNQVIEEWESNKEHRFQHRYIGTLHANNREFVGFGPRTRNTVAHKRRVVELLENVNEARREGYDSRFATETGNAPIESGGPSQ